jgi:hypothetical protein|tara:strand:- start:15 stop:248 length:234 start_codon:yes stop_codon:yes gene_type:complete
MTKEKITRAEAENLVSTRGFTWEQINEMFDVTSNPRSYTFTVEKERQFAIKVLNVISNLSLRERERVLQRAIKVNKV